MIIEKSLEINTFSRFGFRKSIRISSPICSVDSSGLNVRTNRIQRKPTKTIIIPTFLLNSHQNRGEKQERKLERKTAERQISQTEKALQHKGFSDRTILLDNTISNPHPSAAWVHLRTAMYYSISKGKNQGFFASSRTSGIFSMIFP